MNIDDNHTPVQPSSLILNTTPSLPPVPGPGLLQQAQMAQVQHSRMVQQAAAQQQAQQAQLQQQMMHQQLLTQQLARVNNQSELLV